MKNREKTIPLAAIALLLVAASPAAYASTLKVNLNPTTRVADVTSMSTTTLVLTYPSNSTLSHFLGNYSSSVSWSGTFAGSSQGATELQGSFDVEDHGVSVQSMNVSYSLTSKGNATALVVDKETDISAIVQGVFKVENGSVVANLGWKSFEIPGQMTLTFQTHTVDVNYVGSSMDAQFSDHPLIAASIIGMFGGDDLWHRPTLNFSALNSPLSTWTRNYDSVTNTTTYSKTITGEKSLNASADFNGQKYTLTVKSDPSAQVAIQGYATAEGDALVVQPTPLLLTPTVWVAGAAVAIAAVGGAAYLIRRSRSQGPVKGPEIPGASK
jgi:hypothetical protein